MRDRQRRRQRVRKILRERQRKRQRVRKIMRDRQRKIKSETHFFIKKLIY